MGPPTTRSMTPICAAGLKREGGFVFDASSGTGWASRAIIRDGNHVADLYVAVELKALLAERQSIRRNLLLATVFAGLAAAAIGFLIVRRMISPVRLLTEQLRRAQAGDLKPVSPELLPPRHNRIWPTAQGL